MFNPENFSKSARSSRPACAFLGFGQGPRNCIGTRFALQELKIALASLVTKFDFAAGKQTPKTVEVDPIYPGNWFPKQDIKILVKERM